MDQLKLIVNVISHLRRMSMLLLISYGIFVSEMIFSKLSFVSTTNPGDADRALSARVGL